MIKETTTQMIKEEQRNDDVLESAVVRRIDRRQRQPRSELGGNARTLARHRTPSTLCRVRLYRFQRWTSFRVEELS